MPNTINSWRRRMIGVACAAALAGCSTSKSAMTQSSSSPMPDRQSTLVPGTADRNEIDALRNPAKLHVAYARWQEQQRQLPQARDSYQKALSHDPKSVDALLGLSRLDQLAGRTAEAEQRLTRAEELQPRSSLISAAWAEYYAAQKRWPEAISRYRQAIERDGNELLYRHQLAVFLANAGQLDESVATFTPLVGAAEAHYNVGYLLLHQGQSVAAEEQFQRALALKPDLTTAATMLARSRRDRNANGSAAPVMTAASSVLQTPAVTPTTESGTIEPVAWKAHHGGTNSKPVADVPQPPAGLTPQQLEQWYNQRAAGQ